MKYVQKTLELLNNGRRSKETVECTAFFHLAIHFKLKGKKLVDTYTNVMDLYELQDEIHVTIS